MPIGFTDTKAVVCVAHDFIESTDRFTGIDRNGTENSRPTYQMKANVQFQISNDYEN